MPPYHLLLLLLLLALLPSSRGFKPTERCSGQKMYYTPLLSPSGESLGVCDSSCLSIAAPPPAVKRKRTGIKRLDHPASSSSAATTPPYRCDETKTLPEDDLDPEEDGKRFPFHMRTCRLVNSAATTEDEKAAQVAFEQACIKAQGFFTNPYYKTWLK
ncbi:hypothetical protein ACQY0O_002277 [Thecaphora frezii]